MTATNALDGSGPIVVKGIVQGGDRRARQFGFPTANICDVHDAVEDGVYAGIVRLDPPFHLPRVAAISVGRRSTYYAVSGDRLLEAHLLGFHGDLYGSEVTVELHLALRPQIRFEGTEQLVRQLAVDISETGRWARRAGHGSLLAPAS